MDDRNSNSGPLASPPTAAPQQDPNHYVAMVAHELRDPLMPILNAAAVLLRDCANVQMVQHCASVIDRQARTMNNLIDDLMNVSRLQTGKLELHRGRVTMGEIVRRCLESATAACEQRGQTLKVSISSAPMDLHVDAAKLAQALRNLIVNASKYSERGAEIRIRADRDGGDAVVMVIDKGVGIAAEDLTNIFSLFMQRPGVGERADGGLGIGLFLARRFTEAHGGSLRAASPGIGLGSTFTLRIPCLPVEMHASAGDVSTPSADRTPFSPPRNTHTRATRDAHDQAR